jgi:hypothetical protein
MDPTPATQHMDSVTVAAFVALAMGLMEIIKQLVNWLGKKITGKDKDVTTLSVQLDPEVSRLIHESSEQVKQMSAVVFRTDNDGVPLVYSDRKAEENVSRLAELMKDLADSQRRLADSMARLDQAFESHDKTDAIVFARMSDAQTRIEAIAQNNRESLIEFRRDHAAALAALDKIQRDHVEHDRRVAQAISLQQEIISKITK